MKSLKQHYLLVIFLSIYFLITAYKLINYPTPFFDWDEGINAQVAKETIGNNSLVPLWQGATWLDKPPLPFIFFGTIMKLTPFIAPEISLRIVSLLLSIISLVFVYALYIKAAKSASKVHKLIAVLAVMITSFTPIYLQRSQILNLDVFLLIGWLGYLLFVQNFWLSLFFLCVAVLSKSLLGFYPVIILLIYQLFLYILSFRTKRSGLDKSLFKKMFFQLFSHVAILAIWYLAMLLIFKGQFWQQHIIETHFKRVTASIESHFGQRTYYIDLLFQELGIFTWISIAGTILVILNLFQDLIKKNKIGKYLYSFFILPWFIFLNLTKTKIFWYLYPAIPQFAFLSVYPLILIPHVILNGVKRSEESLNLFQKILVFARDPSFALRMTAGLIIIAVIFYQNFVKTNFFTTFYSKPEDHYRLALYAKDRCDSLTVLVGKETRDATKTLEDLGLTITSTKQWGDHPSIVYYFGRKVDYYYDKDIFENKLTRLQQNSCISVYEDDLNEIKILDRANRKHFGNLVLIKVN